MKSYVRNETSIVIRLICLILVSLAAGLFYYSIVLEENVLEVDNTTVATVYLGNKNTNEYQLVLTNRIVDFKREMNYTIIFQDYEYKINSNILNYDIERTVENIISNYMNSFVVTINEDSFGNILDDIENSLPQEIRDNILLDTLYDDIIKEAKVLTLEKIYYLSDYLSDELIETEIASTVITPVSNLSYPNIRLVDEIIIDSNSYFSLLSALEDENLNNEEMSMIGSAIKELVRHTNFKDLYSHSYEVLPEWAKVGANVRILEKNEYDLTFINPNEYNFVVKITPVDLDSIKFSLHSYPFTNSYKQEFFKIDTINYNVEVVDNPNLDLDEENVIVTETLTSFIYQKVVTEGVNGSVYEIYREITSLDGNKSYEILEREYYHPVNEVVEQKTVLKVG